jgi:hypothetical protein
MLFLRIQIRNHIPLTFESTSISILMKKNVWGMNFFAKECTNHISIGKQFGLIYTLLPLKSGENNFVSPRVTYIDLL